MPISVSAVYPTATVVKVTWIEFHSSPSIVHFQTCPPMVEGAASANGLMTLS
ncbi:MAG: hypothetical protein LBI99_03910 [Propionibacteriaceae bacterium]|nr:hypothetical protein [Propionibacteriaceae bacterium]